MTEQQKLEELARVTQSPQLQNSESLCNLLRFLVKMSFESPAAPPKEYQIAMEVFGRSVEFDPRLDSTVRVQTSRLRSKLTEYYAGPGADNPLQIEVPRGSYSAVFHPRVQNHIPTPPTASATVELAHAPSLPAMLLPRGAAIWVIAALLLGGALGAGAFSWLRASTPIPSELVQPAVGAFWQNYKDSAEPPVVVLHQAVTADTVGAGEAFAIHSLARLFHDLDRRVVVRQQKNLSPEDWGKHNFIYLGFAKSRPMSSGEFRFQGELGIANLKPASGEPSTFLGSRNGVDSDDFALIEFRPGDLRNPSSLMLAGITTYGTQAAVEFVCTNESIEQLLFELNGDRSRKVVPFAAILHVKLQNGALVGSRIAALRRLY